MATVKEITAEEAVILNFRKLQLNEQRKHNKKINYKKLMDLTQPEPGDTFTPLLDLEEKKNNLQSYFFERMN